MFGKRCGAGQKNPHDVNKDIVYKVRPSRGKSCGWRHIFEELLEPQVFSVTPFFRTAIR